MAAENSSDAIIPKQPFIGDQGVMAKKIPFPSSYSVPTRLLMKFSVVTETIALW